MILVVVRWCSSELPRTRIISFSGFRTKYQFISQIYRQTPFYFSALTLFAFIFSARLQSFPFPFYAAQEATHCRCYTRRQEFIYYFVVSCAHEPRQCNFIRRSHEANRSCELYKAIATNESILRMRTERSAGKASNTSECVANGGQAPHTAPAKNHALAIIKLLQRSSALETSAMHKVCSFAALSFVVILQKRTCLISFIRFV